VHLTSSGLATTATTTNGLAWTMSAFESSATEGGRRKTAGVEAGRSRRKNAGALAKTEVDLGSQTTGDQPARTAEDGVVKTARCRESLTTAAADGMTATRETMATRSNGAAGRGTVATTRSDIMTVAAMERMTPEGRR